MKHLRKVSAFCCLLATTAFVLCGCATLFHGSTDTITYSSAPSSAKVYVNGQLVGTTPFELAMKSNQTYIIQFRKEGYGNKTVVLNASVGAGWVILDILGGLLPVIVDAATGDWYSLNQDHVTAALEAQKAK